MEAANNAVGVLICNNDGDNKHPVIVAHCDIADDKAQVLEPVLDVLLDLVLVRARGAVDDDLDGGSSRNSHVHVAHDHSVCVAHRRCAGVRDHIVRVEVLTKQRQRAQPCPRHCDEGLVHDHATHRHGERCHKLEVARPRHPERLVHDHLVQQPLHIFLCAHRVIQSVAAVVLERSGVQTTLAARTVQYKSRGCNH